ncbi:DinB family protein [Hymenobacter daeguensis]
MSIFSSAFSTPDFATIQAGLNAQLALLARHWADFSDAELGQRPAPGRWSRKEILGHLIDSAFNNYQRFVLAQLTPAPLQLTPYDQDAWVRLGDYQNRPADALLALWTSLNQQILHLLAALPEAALSLECRSLNGNPVTLHWLIGDYVLHLEHHVHQIMHE